MNKESGLKHPSTRRTWLYLLLILLISIIIRSWPAWVNPAWGCDFGIYYGLTKSLVETGRVFNDYTGWGSSYQYFPTLYMLTGIVHWVTGLDILAIMPKIAPVIGGLSVLLFYFLCRMILEDERRALLAALFLAVLPFHVYQTSHAAPLTTGHFFMMLSLYLFMKYRKNTRYIIPLTTSTILLVMSHHLTTYFYLLSLIGIIIMENSKGAEWAYTIKKDLSYLISASIIVFLYWILVAKDVYNTFMNNGLKIGPYTIGADATIALFYISLFSLLGLTWFKRRYGLFRNVDEPTCRSSAFRFTVSFTICLGAMIIFSFVNMPWTNFKFTYMSIIYAIPLISVISLGVAGYRAARFKFNGEAVRGWVIFLLISFLYALFTNSKQLPPDRHLEYIMMPLSILAVYGFEGLVPGVIEYLRKLKNTKNSSLIHAATFKRRVIMKKSYIYVSLIILLAASNAASVYPGFVSLNASYEAITDQDIEAIKWIERNLDRNKTVIASDHRLARMCEAVGFRTTLDQADLIWSAVTLDEYLDELEGEGKNYTRITHVLIDDIMRERVVHVHYGDIQYMTNESYEKFTDQPFRQVYRNATVAVVNDELTEVQWVEIYEVDWEYIEKEYHQTK